MKWVEMLIDHPTFGVKGLKKELADKDADTLIAAGVAKSCEKPEGQPSPEALAAATEIKKYCDAEIQKGIETFREEQKQNNLTITKHFGANVPATAKDAAVEKRFGFKSMGEYFHAVEKAYTPGGTVDERLTKPLEINGKTVQGLNTYVGSEGGYLVPQEFSLAVMEYAFKDAPFASRCDQRTISGGSLTLNALDESDRATGSRRGGVRGYWLEEGDEFTKSKPKFRRLKLNPHKIGVFYYATQEEMDDATGSQLESKLAQYAGEEIRWMVNEAIFTGNGVGKPLGILNAPCLVTVAAEGGQTADTINYLNVKKMYYRMMPDSLPNAAWFININCFSSLMDMAWPTASGTVPVFVSGGQYPSVAGAPFGTLFGRPIIVTEHNETLGDVGDIVFADMSQYILGIKSGVQAAMSMHVAFTSEQLCWRFSYRVDGQPWMNSALTPAKGTANTLSPFVALAAR